MSKYTRRSEPRWDMANRRWVLDVQRDGERRKFTSRTPKAAGRREVEAMADKWLESGCSDMRLQVAWELFDAHILETRKSDQYRLYHWAMRDYVVPTIGPSKKLSAITPSMWQDVLEHASRSGLAKSSVVSIRGCISMFLKYARRNRWDVERLEDGDLYLPTSLPPTPEKRILTPEQVRTLFADDTIERDGKIVHDWYINLYRFALATGMRRGELMGLMHEDVTEDGVITIRRSLGKDGSMSTGKTANARRTFKLTSVAMDVLKAQADMVRKAGIISPYVFPSRTGRPAQSAVVTWAWIHYRNYHGFDGVSLHGLRHTFISMVKNDVPLSMIKATVGHSTSMATLGIYGHTVDGESVRAAELTDTVFRSILS